MMITMREVFWAVSDILGFLPDPTQIITALIHHRTDLPDQVVRERLEHLLMITLGRPATDSGRAPQTSDQCGVLGRPMPCDVPKIRHGSEI